MPVEETKPQENTSHTSIVGEEPTAVQQHAAAGSLFQWLTVERLLYAIALAMGAGLRLLELAVHPLQTTEAAGAWRAWLAVSGLGAPVGAASEVDALLPPTSPLFYSLQSLIFWLMGSGDVLARVPGVIAGVVMILSTWWLRPYLGRSVALFLAFLMAVDPWLVAYSRLADGTILSASLGLLTLIGLMHLTVGQRATRTGQRGWLWTTAIAGGLLLVSGMHAWNFLPVLLLFIGLFGWRWQTGVEQSGVEQSGVEQSGADQNGVEDGQETSAAAAGSPVLTATNSPPDASTVHGEDGHASDATDAQLPADDESPSARGSLGLALALFVGAAVLGATGWLARPEGLGYISTSVTAWVDQFISGAGIAYPGAWVLLRLVVDQPLLALFGPLGLIYLWWKRPGPAVRNLPRWPLFLTLWTLWGLLLVASPGRGPLSLLMLGLPLLFATAHGADGIIRHIAWRTYWREMLVLYGALLILLTSGVFWLVALIARSPFDGALARVSLMVVGLVVMMVVFYALWVNGRQAGLVTAQFVGSVLFLATVSSSWQLNVEFDPMQPDGFFAEITDPDVRRLATNVQTLSAQRAGDPNAIPVLVEMRERPDPLLGWYLRDMHRLTWSPALGLDAGAPADALLISQDESLRTNQLGANYLGDDYGLRMRWLPTPWLTDAPTGVDNQPGAAWSTRVQPLLRWMLYRTVRQIPASERVVLWAPPG